MPGLLDTLSGTLTKVGSVTGPAGAIASGIGSLLSLFPKKDMSKINATGSQENIQKAAMNIEQMVQSGQMDADSALQMLQGLEASAQRLAAGGDPNMQRGLQTASIIINNVKANLLQKRNQNISAPIDGRLTGSEAQQGGQLRTGLRNLLAGQQSGLEGSPLARLAAPPTNPMDNLGKASDALRNALPPLPLPKRNLQEF